MSVHEGVPNAEGVIISQECPPIIILMILRFSTKNLTTCQGKNLRQNLVAPVGDGGKVISLGP